MNNNGVTVEFPDIECGKYLFKKSLIMTMEYHATGQEFKCKMYRTYGIILKYDNCITISAAESCKLCLPEDEQWDAR